jgi:hypothetical protein
VKRSAEPGDLHIQLYRDPIERYVSSWYHRVACCAVIAGENSGCKSQQETAYFVQSLLSGNGLIGDERICLSFSEFVDQLETSVTSGRGQYLNMHWLSQDVVCPKTPNTLYLKIEEVEDALKRLAKRGDIDADLLDGIKIGRLQIGQKSSSDLVTSLAEENADAMMKLCKLAHLEYESLNIAVNVACHKVRDEV